MMSVHVEVLPHLHRTIQAIKALGVQAGVVLNPSTPVVILEQIAGDVDFVLVMSVNPGFGGQKFIPRSTRKVAEVRAALDASGNTSAFIEIDGGIDAQTAPRGRGGRRARPGGRQRRLQHAGSRACDPRPESDRRSGAAGAPPASR